METSEDVERREGGEGERCGVEGRRRRCPSEAALLCFPLGGAGGRVPSVRLPLCGAPPVAIAVDQWPKLLPLGLLSRPLHRQLYTVYGTVQYYL